MHGYLTAPGKTLLMLSSGDDISTTWLPPPTAAAAGWSSPGVPDCTSLGPVAAAGAEPAEDRPEVVSDSEPSVTPRDLRLKRTLAAGVDSSSTGSGGKKIGHV